TTAGPAGAVRVASVPEIRGGELVAVTQMATPLDLALAPVTRLALLFLPVGVGALALAAAGGLVVAGRALRPVRAAFDRQRAFVADASHELKTPLALVKLDGEVLRRDPDAADRGAILAHQGAEIDRMSALLSELLLLARLDASKVALAREPFDLAPVLTETADRFRHRAREAGVVLEVRADGELPALGDASHTRRILSALLDNALRFAPPGGCVAVTGSRRHGRIEAAVDDTGPGIDPADLPYLFDRFYRATARRATGTPTGGAGLGLAIARDTARLQGGDLVVANRAGCGARAILSLPEAG
ncbi:MAG: Two-component system sensor histidine kinase, partial [uncultured Thermomicrobiales bacterium]